MLERLCEVRKCNVYVIKIINNMANIIVFSICIIGYIIFAWSGYELGKKVNKSPEIPEQLTLPDKVRFWGIRWEFASDMVVRRVNVYGYVYINSEKIKVIIRTFSDDDMDYNIRCAEELIDKIYERI